MAICNRAWLRAQFRLDACTTVLLAAPARLSPCAKPRYPRDIVPQWRRDLRLGTAGAGKRRLLSGPAHCQDLSNAGGTDQQLGGGVQAGLNAFRSRHFVIRGMGIASDLGA